MYGKILVTLDATAADRTIVEHIKPLARMCSSRIVLLHVADGWAARHFGEEAVSAEVKEDQEYLEKVRQELVDAGVPAEAELAFGDPAKEIIKWVAEKHCDLIAMTTHGHRFVADLVLGTTVAQVQHAVRVPVLLVKVAR